MAAGKNGSGAVADLAEGVRMLTVEDILSADDIREQVVFVPEWGGNVRVRAFSKAVEQQLRTESGGVENFDQDRFELLLFITGVVEPQFSIEHIELLKAKNTKPFDAVVKAIMDVAGLTKEAVDKAKATFPPTP